MDLWVVLILVGGVAFFAYERGRADGLKWARAMLYQATRHEPQRERQ